MALVERRQLWTTRCCPLIPSPPHHRKEPYVQPRLALAGICFCKNICLNIHQGDSLLPLILQESLLLRSPAHYPQCGCHISHVWAASMDLSGRSTTRERMPFPDPRVFVILLIRFLKTGNSLPKKPDALDFSSPSSWVEGSPSSCHIPEAQHLGGAVIKGIPLPLR